jgi:hypothetical protein
MAGQPVGVSWSELYQPTLPVLSTVYICHVPAPTTGDVLTAAAALDTRAVCADAAAVFDALPACTAELSVTAAVHRRTTATTATKENDLEFDMIAS